MYSCLRNRCRRRSRFLDSSTALLYSLWRTWWVWEDIPSRLRPPFNFAENRERGKKEVTNYQQYCYHQAFLLQTRVTSHLLHVWVVPAWVLSVPSMFTVFKNKNEYKTFETGSLIAAGWSSQQTTTRIELTVDSAYGCTSGSPNRLWCAGFVGISSQGKSFS